MPFKVETAIKGLTKMAEVVESKKEYLTDLDSSIGDADHGINMNRGMKRVTEKICGNAYSEFGDLFRDVAMTIMGAVGGSAGPLYAAFFIKLAQRLKGKNEVSLAEFASALEDGLRSLMTMGKSSPGDKTMVDSLYPAILTLGEHADNSDRMAWNAAAYACERGMKSTAPMLARRGRSSYLGERSIGYQDPGATTSYYLIASFRDASLED